MIKQTLTGTKCKVKFMDEISKKFEIKKDVRQDDGLSPIVFVCLRRYCVHGRENSQALRMTLGLAQIRRK